MVKRSEKILRVLKKVYNKGNDFISVSNSLR